jgi:predicted nucleotidyltransferase
MTLSEHDIAWIVRRIRSRYDARAIYLFGSRVKARSHERSDVDLLVVGPSRLPRGRRGREVAAALAPFSSRFDLLFYTERELAEERKDRHSFIASIMSDARLLYDHAWPS